MFEKATVDSSAVTPEKILQGSFLDEMNQKMIHHPFFRHITAATALLSLSAVAQAREPILPEINMEEYHILKSRVLDVNSPYDSDYLVDLYRAGTLKEYFSNNIPEKSGNYNVYKEKDVPQEFLATYAKSIYQGAAMAEYSFGFDPGSVIKDLHFVSSEYSNAGVDNNGIGNDYSLMFTTAQIKEAEHEKYNAHFTLRNTSHHEAIHALDYHLGITNIFDPTQPGDYSESNIQENVKTYREFAQTLFGDKEFMDIIAEGNFFSDHNIHPEHGHPDDNALELFATFLTSTSHTAILDRLDQLENDHIGFKEKYLTLAQKILPLFNGKIEDNTPIINRLQRIINTLKQK